MKHLAGEEARAKGIKTVLNGDPVPDALFPTPHSPTAGDGAEEPPFDAPPRDNGAMPSALSTEDERFDDAFRDEDDENTRAA